LPLLVVRDDPLVTERPHGLAEGVMVGVEELSFHPGLLYWSWTAAPEAISSSTSSRPQATSASRVCAPGRAGGIPNDVGVRENRGAGAGCRTPSCSTKTPRASRCGCDAPSGSTGATQASVPSKRAVRSAWVLVAKVSASTLRSSGQFAG